MKKTLSAILSAIMLCTLCVAPASALEVSIGAPDDYLFGRPTSSTGNHPDRRASRSARHDPQGATAPCGERECHLRGAASHELHGDEAASTDPVRDYNETP